MSIEEKKLEKIKAEEEAEKDLMDRAGEYAENFKLLPELTKENVKPIHDRLMKNYLASLEEEKVEEAKKARKKRFWERWKKK